MKSSFRRVKVLCPEEKEKYESWKDYCLKRQITPGPPDRIVTWHGKVVELLGTWIGKDYEYSAIRFEGQKHHEIIKPKYLHDYH